MIVSDGLTSMRPIFMRWVLILSTTVPMMILTIFSCDDLPDYLDGQSPEHILATSQQQHVYATPSRVQTPDALLSSQDVFESRHNNHYTRPSRSKSRNSTLHGHYQPSANVSPTYSITWCDETAWCSWSSWRLLSPLSSWSPITWGYFFLWKNNTKSFQAK